MASTRVEKARLHAPLAGDGALLTAAALRIVVGLDRLPGTGTPAWIVAGMIGMAAALLEPLIAWRVHGRRLDGTATLGAVLGLIAGAATAVAIIPLLVVAVAFLAAIVWVDVDALRDLWPRRRAHLWLDILRQSATVVQVVCLVSVIVDATGASDVDGTGSCCSS